MCRYVIKLLLSNSIILHGCFFLIFSPKMLTLNMTFMLVMVIILHLNSEVLATDSKYSCKSCNVGRTTGAYVCRECVSGSAAEDAHFSCGTCRIGAQSSTFNVGFSFNCRRCRNNGPELDWICMAMFVRILEKKWLSNMALLVPNR